MRDKYIELIKSIIKKYNEAGKEALGILYEFKQNNNIPDDGTEDKELFTILDFNLRDTEEGLSRLITELKIGCYKHL